MNPTEIWQIFTTVGNADDATRIARDLVERRLAGCVQIDGPIRSIYRWQDNIADETEFRCTIKTTAAAIEECTARLKEIHPYDTPEILATSLPRVDPAYAGWLAEQTVP